MLVLNGWSRPLRAAAGAQTPCAPAGRPPAGSPAPRAGHRHGHHGDRREEAAFSPRAARQTRGRAGLQVEGRERTPREREPGGGEAGLLAAPAPRGRGSAASSGNRRGVCIGGQNWRIRGAGSALGGGSGVRPLPGSPSPAPLPARLPAGPSEKQTAFLARGSVARSWREPVAGAPAPTPPVAQRRSRLKASRESAVGLSPGWVRGGGGPVLLLGGQTQTRGVRWSERMRDFARGRLLRTSRPPRAARKASESPIIKLVGIPSTVRLKAPGCV